MATAEPVTSYAPDILSQLQEDTIGSRRRSEQRFEVLFCSRIHARKRPELFVEAARELNFAYPGQFLFRVVGPDGGELATITKAGPSFEDGSFSYDGSLPPGEVPDALERADVLMLPSLNEPFPMIVLEALALGVPVIIDATCGLAPILTDQAGVRIVISNPTTLADAVLSIKESPVDERKGARKLAATEFSTARLEKQLTAAYKEAVG
ncbi:glycosyltransferase [Arthrobacter sp.]|uniref:glycosyltransferase n=1 Tax=Arthrobacter sp. TaxID=1667 RepID=UPI003A8E205E